MKRLEALADALAFYCKFKIEGGCWIWQGAKNEKGYGKVWFHGRVVYAHRTSFILHRGPIPEGALVLHSCDNTSCVNPEHLRAGTAAENSTDMVQRGRSTAGERNPRATLTGSEVREILNDYSPRRNSYGKLAARFGVHPQTVAKIVRRERWAHQ